MDNSILMFSISYLKKRVNQLPIIGLHAFFICILQQATPLIQIFKKKVSVGWMPINHQYL